MATIVGVFSNGIDLERALFELDEYNFRDEILVIDREHELSNAPGARRWMGIDSRQPDEATLASDMYTLEGLGVTARNAALYAKAAQEGNKLLVVQASGKEIFRVYEIMSHCDSKIITACDFKN